MLGASASHCRQMTVAVAQAIARGLSHPFGVGWAYFRIGTSKPRWVDTVFGGCYRKDVFELDLGYLMNSSSEIRTRYLTIGSSLKEDEFCWFPMRCPIITRAGRSPSSGGCITNTDTLSRWSPGRSGG